MQQNNPYFQNNQLLKKADIKQPFTEEQIIELIKCSKDPIHFIKNYTYIINLDKGKMLFELYPFQEKWIESCVNNRNNIIVTARQVGKTSTIAAYLLYQAIFNQDYKIAILANKGATAREILARIQIMFENLPFWIKPGIKVWNKGSMILANGSKIFAAATTNSSIRGESINCLTGDTRVTIEDDDIISEITLGDLFNRLSSEDYMKVLVENDSETIIKSLDDDIIELKETKYHRWYNNIIKTAKLENRVKSKNQYFESHHIIPSSMGGSNDKDNLILLTAKEHFICHKLLVRMTTGKDKAKMVYALFMMKNMKHYHMSSTEYSNLRKIHSSNMSESMKGRSQSVESRRKIGEASKMRWENNREKIILDWKVSDRNKKISIALSDYIRESGHVDKINKNPEKIRKTAEKHKGMKRSDDAKMKMSESKQKFIEKNGTEFLGKGCKYIHNIETRQRKRVSKNFIVELPWASGFGSRS